ncbi:MAG: serine hydrolase [Rubricoccaceae bacterium]
MPVVRLALVLVLLAALSPARAQTTPWDGLPQIIDALAAQHPEATVAVAVRAADGRRYDRLAGRSFHAASTMKVALMVEAYRRDADGSLPLATRLPVHNTFRSLADGSPFAVSADSDEAIYKRLGDSLSVRDLVERAITISSNLATNLLVEALSAEAVQATVERLGAAGLEVRRGVDDLRAFEAGLSNRTTAAALAALLEALRDGRAVSPEADAAMRDVLARQTFRDMIPAGLPADVRVAHKTGTISRVNHDAGIVYPPGAPPYVLVILTEGLADEAVSSRLGAAISAAVYAALAP